MKNVFITISDAAIVKKLERIQRTFRKGENVLTPEQKERLMANWKKLKGMLKKEKVQRKVILSKIKAYRVEIRKLQRDKPEGYRNKVRKYKVAVNKLAMKWYNKPIYKSVLPKEPKAA